MRGRGSCRAQPTWRRWPGWSPTPTWRICMRPTSPSSLPARAWRAPTPAPSSSARRQPPNWRSSASLRRRPSPARPLATAIPGPAFATQPQIAVLDAYGNVVTNDTSTVTAALATGSGPLQGTLTASAVNGVATFSNLADNKAETITLQFSDNVLTGVTDATAITISAAALAQYAVTAASPQTRGAAFLVTVTGQDSF